MSERAGELVVLLVGSQPGRLAELRSAVAATDAGIVVEDVVEPAAVLEGSLTLDCDCVLVEVPVDGASLAEIRTAAWTGGTQIPVVPFAVVDAVPPATAATAAFDVHRVSPDELHAVEEPVERAVEAGTAFDAVRDAVLAATTDVLLAVTPGGTIRYATPPVEDLVGEPPDSVVGSSLLAYVHPDDRTAAVEQLHRRAGDEPRTVTPVRFRTGDVASDSERLGESDGENGDTGDAEHGDAGDGENGSAGSDQSGSGPGAGRGGEWESVFLDRRSLLGESPQDGVVALVRSAAAGAGPLDVVTDRRRLLESAVDPMCFILPDGVLYSVNDALTAFLGRDRDELVGTHVSAIIGEEQYEAALDSAVVGDDDAAGEEEQITYEFSVERDDEVVWCEAVLSPIFEDGSIVGTVGLIHDITGRKRREQQLSKYETIAEDTPIALFTFDEEATITWTNGVYPEVLDLERERVVGRPFTELIAEGYYDAYVVEVYLEAVRTLLSSKNDVEQESLEVETHLPSGKTLVHEVYISLLPLDDGEFQGTIIAFRDITEQRAYERELERQNERLDAFTSVVSHDLRNPIAIADGYLEMALEDDDLGRVEDAREAIDRMESLVEQLLVLSREGRAVEEPVSVQLDEVAWDAWTTADTGESTLEVDGSMTLLADRSRLQQALENLFRNAVEHGNDGDRPVAVTVELLDGETGFAVADDGVGIPEENHERVFERGFTTNPDGTGFGLDIVKTIVEAHGWSIRVTDAASGGARFEIRTRTETRTRA